LEAMVKLGELNSRMKDFFDLWLLSGAFDFEGVQLGDAIGKTFDRRRTTLFDDIPIALTEEFASNRQKQAQWSGFVRRIKLSGVPPLPAVIDALRAFLLPPMHAAAHRSRYDFNWVAAKREWSAN
jgi:hypothetical protein